MATPACVPKTQVCRTLHVVYRVLCGLKSQELHAWFAGVCIRYSWVNKERTPAWTDRVLWNLRLLRSGSVAMEQKARLSKYYIPLSIAWPSVTTVLCMPSSASRYGQHLQIPSSDNFYRLGCKRWKGRLPLGFSTR